VTEYDGRHQGGRGEPSAQDTGTTAGRDDLAERLGDVARTLQQQDNPTDTLSTVVRAALDLVPGAEEGSISVVIGRKDVTSQVPSGELPEQVDAVQAEVGQGPCLDAVYDQQTVRVPDMRAEKRWPEFAKRAAELGALSMLSFQLYVEGDNLGALNLYAKTPGAFTDDSEHVGLLVAAHAAVAYSGAQTEAQLNRAIGSRDLIGQAKGILMERFDVDADRAFEILVTFSRDSHVKLHEVARRLTQRR
jgi:transcriptional regulator with GAF, ATPase, and Fis domain